MPGVAWRREQFIVVRALSGALMVVVVGNYGEFFFEIELCSTYLVEPQDSD